MPFCDKSAEFEVTPEGVLTGLAIILLIGTAVIVCVAVCGPILAGTAAGGTALLAGEGAIAAGTIACIRACTAVATATEFTFAAVCGCVVGGETPAGGGGRVVDGPFLPQKPKVPDLSGGPTSRYIPVAERASVIDETVGYCRWCGIKLNTGRGPNQLHLDHIEPWSVGGPSLRGDLTPSCRTCNQRKGSMPFDDWMKVIRGG